MADAIIITIILVGYLMLYMQDRNYRGVVDRQWERHQKREAELQATIHTLEKLLDQSYARAK